MEEILEILDSPQVWDYILEQKPTLRQGVLDFFSDSVKNSNEKKLSRYSKKLWKQYREMFNQVDAKGSANGIVNTRGYNQRFAYAGENSKTADKSKLFVATEMEKLGKESEEIRKETGWFRGYDGKWRYEIDDSKMKIDNGDKNYLIETSSTLLQYLVKHDELYKAYPQLEEMMVKTIDVAKDGDAYYNQKTNTIVINKKSLMSLSAKGLKEVLVHEIQHAIQDIEGLTPGTNTSDFAKYLRTAGEIEAYDVGDRVYMTVEQRKNTRPDIDRTDVVFADGGNSFSAEYKSSKINADILSLIEKVENSDFKQNDFVELEKIDSKTAKEIEKLTGIDVTGWKVKIEARQIKHILNRHGKNGKADHSMSDYNNLARIESIIKL